jgi:phosphatidylglycerophosphate synthase
MGPANRITLLRAVLIVAVTGLLVLPGPPAPALLWWIVGVSTFSMVLDGFDGWVARRTGTSTEFGARFDMELDAFLMLVLSGLVLESGKAGAWVLLIGLLRYLFVGAGWIWPRLRGRLPDRFRRKLVCVVQGVALLSALAPVVTPAAGTALTAGALTALAYSFAADVAWLVRRPVRGAG